MRNFLYLPFLILVLSTSCQKKEHNPVKTTSKNQLSLKSNGKLQALSVSTSWFIPDEILLIEAGASNLDCGKYQIYLQSNVSPGFYEYGASSLPILAFNFFKDNKSYNAYDGTFMSYPMIRLQGA
jgi:hypothetical protein